MSTNVTDFEGRPVRRCQRPPNDQPLNREAHRARMQERRGRQLARTPGFTAVRNRRINSAIEAAAAMTALGNAEQVKLGLAKPLSARVIRDEAVAHVRRSLPRRPMAFDWRNGLPTRNDNPEYRK